MPSFDFPVETLKSYTGINPRPVDFDTYWEEALLELDAVDPEVELVPNRTVSIRNAECFDLWFSSVGGARIYAKYLRPVGGKECPALLRFHGYTARSADWTEHLTFTHEGLCVAAMDCRGQGGRSEDVGGVKGTTLNGHFVRGLDDPDPRKLLFRSIFLDTVQLARVVAALDEVDENRIGVGGASQGGALAIACAALYPSIKRIVSVHPFLSDFKRVWEMDLAEAAYEELRSFFRWHDPRHEREEAIFTKLGYIDVHHLASRVKGETTLLISLMDQICPPSTQYAVFNNLVCRKKSIVFPDFAHEFLPGMYDITLNEMLKL